MSMFATLAELDEELGSDSSSEEVDDSSDESYVDRTANAASDSDTEEGEASAVKKTRKAVCSTMER